MELQRHARSLLKSLTGKGVRCKDATEEVILEGEKQIDRRKRNNVTELKIGSNCSEEFSYVLKINQDKWQQSMP